MSDEAALVPEELKHIQFYDDEIPAALVRVTNEAQIYVPLRPICDFLGLSWAGQRERTMRDEVLAEAVRGVRVTRTPGVGGGTQEMLCLPLDLLPGWLFGINANRVKSEVQAKITRYRRECFRVLWDAFKYEMLPSEERAITPSGSGAALAYELATAVANLAREQMQFEQRLMEAARWAKGIEARVTALEVRASTDTLITETQATEIQLAVKTVAQALIERGIQNGYQRVYGELYRRYGIAAYRSLPRSDYEDARTWLHDWHTEITSGKGA